MKPHTSVTDGTQSNPNPRGLLSRPPLYKTVQRTVFLVILDAAGKPIALAPMEQLKNTSISPERIRIVQGQDELSKIWK